MPTSKEEYPSNPTGRRSRPSPSTKPTRNRRPPPLPNRSLSSPSAFFSGSNIAPVPQLYEDYAEISTVASSEPRSFPYSVKQQCWEKAEVVKGRDPARWRRDPLGNLVFKKLVGCSGCLCHDYDHILPFSKGGKSTLDNCQVLQASANRAKGNRTELSKAELAQKSVYCRVSGRDMDLLELSAFGNVKRTQDSGGCLIQ